MSTVWRPFVSASIGLDDGAEGETAASGAPRTWWQARQGGPVIVSAVADVPPLARPMSGDGASVDLVVGGTRSLEVHRRLLASSGRIDGEAYLVGRGPLDKGVVGALALRNQRGATTSIVVQDAVEGSNTVRQLSSYGVDVAPYAGGRQFLHSKLLAGEHEAFVTTATIRNATVGRLDVGFLLHDDDAIRATRELAVTARSGNAAGIAHAARVAAGFGVLVRDPIAQVDFAGPAIRDLIAGAGHSIDIVAKEYNDPRITSLLTQRARSGIQIAITARDPIPPVQLRALREAGVHVRRPLLAQLPLMIDDRFGHRIHFTSVFVDEGRIGFVGSQHLVASYQAREAGVLVSGALAARTYSAIRTEVVRSTLSVAATWARTIGRNALDLVSHVSARGALHV